MVRSVPIAVVIPTQLGRPALNVLLDKIQACDPRPVEILVHIDSASTSLELTIDQFGKDVRVLKSPTQVGPGGARHRCLSECSAPYAVSFDDDSYPVDSDFFGRVCQLFD